MRRRRGGEIEDDAVQREKPSAAVGGRGRQAGRLDRQISAVEYLMEPGVFI